MGLARGDNWPSSQAPDSQAWPESPFLILKVWVSFHWLRGSCASQVRLEEETMSDTDAGPAGEQWAWEFPGPWRGHSYLDAFLKFPLPDLGM